MKKERVLALVDAENLYYTPRKIWGAKARVDFSKLYQLIAQGRSAESIAYESIIYIAGDPIIDQAPFLQALVRMGYTPRIKIIYSERGIYANGNWDEEIIRDGMARISDIDHLVLVSGDGGFSDLVEAYIKRGKRVTVHCFEDDFSPRLKGASEIAFLTQDILMPARRLPVPPPKRSRPPRNAGNEKTVINYL